MVQDAMDVIQNYDPLEDESNEEWWDSKFPFYIEIPSIPTPSFLIQSFADLDYDESIRGIHIAEFQEWADNNDFDFEIIEFHNYYRVGFRTEKHLIFFKLWWQ